MTTYNMAVVPSSAILRSLPPIDFAFPGRKGAFGQPGDTIGPAIVQLPHAVPVDTSAIVLQIVRDRDLHHIAPISEDCRTHILTVDEKSVARDAIWSGGAVGDFKMVLPGDASIRPALIEVRVDIEAIGPARSRLRAIDSVLAEFADLLLRHPIVTSAGGCGRRSAK